MYNKKDIFKLNEKTGIKRNDEKADNCEVSRVTTNVISETEFKGRVENVFDTVSKILSKTLGPYGSTTIIEKYGEMHITKDGWQVLKNIRFDNMVENNILMLLLRISAQVVIKVGDGSTSSIVAADYLLKELSKYDFINNTRPKDLMEILSLCVNTITEKLYENSTKINKETYDEIYKLAYISTNGDKKISNIIKDIYVKTGNPTIEFVNSKTNKTTYEIIDGYKGNITYIDTIFATNDEGNCVIESPKILMFDHKIDMENSLPIIGHAVIEAVEAKTRLVVIAPHYDKHLLDYIRQNINIEMRSTGTSTCVYTRASLVNNMSHELYSDFAMLCGAVIITEQAEESITKENISDYIGTVTNMTIGDKTTLIRGFVNRNENMYKKTIADATAKYNNMLTENEARGIVDIKLHEAKQRVTKLNCNMGVITVGGNSELEKVSNYDLVEDAVKACESAYNYGYNIGCSLVIPQLITRALSDENNEIFTIIAERYGKERTTSLLNIIRDAFVNVYKRIITNKYNTNTVVDIESIDNILYYTFNNGYTKCYDLITESFSDNIINSCETDIEILKASVSIISLLISSNQYITITNPNER